MKTSLAVALLINNVSAVSLMKNDQGVPVYVNPTVMKNDMENATLGLNMTVGPDQVQVLKQHNLAQGVPVHVNPTLMTDTMHDANLGMKIVVGPDELELKKKQALAQGVPVHVNPTKMKNEMESASLDLKNMKVGGNPVNAV